MAVSVEHGFSFWRADGIKLLGWALAMQGRPAEGLAHLREGLGAYRATGALTGVPYDLALLAEVCGQAGLVEEGLAALGEALAIVDRTGERNYEAELHRLEGELRLSHAGTRGGSRVVLPASPRHRPPPGCAVARAASGDEPRACSRGTGPT